MNVPHHLGILKKLKINYILKTIAIKINIKISISITLSKTLNLFLLVIYSLSSYVYSSSPQAERHDPGAGRSS